MLNFVSILEKTKEYVAEEMKNNDPSHDMFHVERVVSNAQKLMTQYPFSETEQCLIILAAYLHDVKDFKYSKQENAAEEAIANFFHSFENSITQEQVNTIIQLVLRVSFSKEKKRLLAQEPEEKLDTTFLQMSAVVQDADRLDAIGAIGISRCMAYSSFKQRPFYNKETIQNHKNESLQQITLLTPQRGPESDTALDHFYEKLFHLEQLMKTPMGKQLAKQRTEYMHQFVNQFFNELN